MPTLRFLQISDLHLDSCLTASSLALPPAKRERVNRDMEHAFGRVAEIARSGRVDVILCPGDLWDDEAVSFQSATFIYDVFESLAPVPVVIAPGNHDPFNAFSYHHPGYFRSKVGRQHPSNVTVFSSPVIERVSLPGLPEVDFYGCCFEENKPRHERLLAGLRPERPEVLSVLLLHGSMDDTLGARGKDAEMAAPFSSRELLEAGFDYTALGHYHRHIAIRDDNGWIRGAYGGIPVARSLDETAEHGILVGEISRGGVSPESLRVIHVDPRRILRITVPVDATVANSAAAAARIDAALATVGAGPEDIVVAALVGRTHPESGQFRFDPDWTGSRCFHLAIDQSALEPEHDIEALLADETSSRRVEGRFAERMRQLILEAGNSPRKAAQLRAAMAYGLDALNGREVKPRRVH